MILLANNQGNGRRANGCPRAWQQARGAYLAYRKQGGYAQFHGGKLLDHILALAQQQKSDENNELCKQLNDDPDTSDSIKQLLMAVIALLRDFRDPALADHPALDFDDAGEILFLIERLAG